MQELGNFILRINVILYANRLEKYISFAINNKLRFIDSLRFVSSSLDNNLVKYLNKNEFRYLSQEFENNVLDLVKQKGF